MGRFGHVAAQLPKALSISCRLLPHMLKTSPPVSVIAPMQTMMIKASMTAYSTEVGPSSRRRNRTILDMAADPTPGWMGRKALAGRGAGPARPRRYEKLPHKRDAGGQSGPKCGARRPGFRGRANRLQPGLQRLIHNLSSEYARRTA